MRRRRALALIAASIAMACGERSRVGPSATDAGETIATATIPPASLKELVASGRIRVAFDVANSQFVQWDGRQPTSGMHLELASALARDLGVTMEPSSFVAYKQQLDAVLRGQADVALSYVVATAGVNFSEAYCEDEWTCIVKGTSTVRGPTDLDRSGTQIATYRDSILQRYLSDTLHSAKVRPVGSRQDAARLVVDGDVEAWFDQRTALIRLANLVPDGRILPEPLTKGRAAFASADGRSDLLAYINLFVGRAKASGSIRDMIPRYNLSVGVTVAP